MKDRLIFRTAILAGEIMLRNGAETYRVEDTINRILSLTHYTIVESYVTPTGIFVTLDHPNHDSMTMIKRVQQRTVHLGKVERVNSVSRQVVKEDITIEEAYEQLKIIKDLPPYSPLVRSISYTFVTGCFALVFNGTIMDALVASVIGLLLGIIHEYFKRLDLIPYLNDMISSTLVASLAVLFTHALHIAQDLNVVIIACIMPMVPGLAITNAIRDTIEGDLVSGVSRGAEAFFVAVSIAVGVGFALKILL